MKPDLLREYRRNRTPHHSPLYRPHVTRAAQALENARYTVRTARRWAPALDAGLVRMEAHTDECYFDDMAGDMFDPSHADTVPGGLRTIEAQRKAYADTLETWGVVCVASYFRTSTDSEWILADSIGGIEGDADIDEIGYGEGLKREALQQLAAALRIEQRARADVRAGRCPRCHGTGEA